MIAHYTSAEMETNYPPLADSTSAPKMLAGIKAAIFNGFTYRHDLIAAAQANLPRTNSFEGLSPQQQNELLKVVSKHPSIIALADEEHPAWIRSLFAFAHAEQCGATEAHDHALAWSQTSPRFNAAHFERDWKSYKSRVSGITVGTLLKAAQDAGIDLSPWLSPPDATTVVQSPLQQLAAHLGASAAAAATIINGVDLWAATEGWAQPDNIEFLYGGMFARGFVTLIGAPGGSLKSSLLTAIGVSCATGRSLLGDDILCRLRVLYMNTEDSRMKQRRNAKACVIHYGISERDLDGWLWIAGVDDINAAHSGGLRLITTDPKTRQGIVNATALQWLKTEIAQREIDVLMLDPFSRLIQGNENSVEVADQLMESLVLLATEKNIAIVIAMHARKGGAGITGDGVAALRGSSAITDSARNVYGLSKIPPEEAIQIGVLNGDTIIAADNLKNNLTRLEDRRYFRPVSVRLPGGDPRKDPQQVERGRWASTVEVFTPLPISQHINDTMRHAAMAAIHTGARDKHGAAVPFSPSVTGKSARNPIPTIAAALRSVVSGLPEAHAVPLAREVLRDLQDHRYVTAQPMKLPSYKRDGAPNGSNDGEGLVCHWNVVPWTSGTATGTATGTAPASAATLDPAAGAPSSIGATNDTGIDPTEGSDNAD